MLGEADRVIPQVVGKASLLGQLVEHAAIELWSKAGLPGLDLASTTHRGKIKKGYLHPPTRFLSLGAASLPSYRRWPEESSFYLSLGRLLVSQSKCPT